MNLVRLSAVTIADTRTALHNLQNHDPFVARKRAQYNHAPIRAYFQLATLAQYSYHKSERYH